MEAPNLPTNPLQEVWMDSISKDAVLRENLRGWYQVKQ